MASWVRPLLWLVLLAGAASVGLTQEQRLSLGGRNLDIRYWPEQEDVAFEVRSYGQQALKDLSETLDLPVTGTISVDIVRSADEFDQRAGVKLPPWTLGVALHHRRQVVLKPLHGKDLQRLVTHELTHVLLDMKMGREGLEPPRWVHEGLAQWMEGEMPAAQRDVLGRASVEGSLLTLDNLEQAFSGKRETVDLAYAQSHTLVDFMIHNGPPGALGRFLEILAAEGDERLALRRALGMPLDVIEKRWLAETRKQYLSRGVPLSVELAIFGAMAALFVVAVVVRFRIAREIRERMQEEERLRALFVGIEPDDEFLEGTNDEGPLRE